MQKTIWEKYAEVLVDYSTDVQKGDLVQIRATSIYAKDLVKAVYKRVLEKAWISAKKANKDKIEASDLLLAITDEPDSLAMKVLDTLGVDAVEIRHGLLRLDKQEK